MNIADQRQALAGKIAAHGRDLLKMAKWLAENRHYGNWTLEPRELCEFGECIQAELIRGKALLTGQGEVLP
jgi:hypothetical protein